MMAFRNLRAALIASCTKVSLGFNLRYIPCLTTRSNSGVLMLPTKMNTRRIFSTKRNNRCFTSNNNENCKIEDHWKHWPYFNESIKWHADWIRWDASTLEVIKHFRAYRQFTTERNDDDDSHYTMHHNTYFYDDETLSEGPLCGPWKIDKNDPNAADPYGIIHSSRPYMRTIACPDRSSTWIMKEIPYRKSGPAGFELFLGDNENLRFSVGIVYNDDGDLSQVSIIREDARDHGLFCSSSPPSIKKHADRIDQEKFLNDFFCWPNKEEEESSENFSTLKATSFKMVVPGPIIETMAMTDNFDQIVNNLKNNRGSGENFIFSTTDGIVIMCPSQLLEESNEEDDENFVVAAAWKKKEENENDKTKESSSSSWTSHIEAKYKKNLISEVVYTKFTTT